MGSVEALPLEELLKDLSVEEQVRIHSARRECERRSKRYGLDLPQPGQMGVERKSGCRDIRPHDYIDTVDRHAICHYNARHPDEEFDAVRSLEQSTVHFRGEAWYHTNFWARHRRSNKIKRFFAEVHYKPPASRSVRSYPLAPVPEAEVHHRPSGSSDQTISASEAEVHDRPSGSCSVCSDQTISAPKAQVCVCHIRPANSSARFYRSVRVPGVGVLDRPPASSSAWQDPRVPIVEVCTIIEEPLERYRRSCAFCPGSLNILHPKGSRKFVCGNDKDRMVQQFQFSRRKRRGFPCPKQQL